MATLYINSGMAAERRREMETFGWIVLGAGFLLLKLLKAR